MNQQLDRTLQEAATTLPPHEVLKAAKRFFARRNGIYAAFPEKEGPTFVALRGQGGEEVIIGVAAADGTTRVTGSTYLFDQQVARFFATLPPAALPAPPAAVPGAPSGPLAEAVAAAPAALPGSGTGGSAA